MRNIPGSARALRWLMAAYLDYLFIAFYAKGGAAQRRDVEKVIPILLSLTKRKQSHT
jgi:hypothetical protein